MNAVDLLQIDGEVLQDHIERPRSLPRTDKTDIHEAEGARVVAHRRGQPLAFLDPVGDVVYGAGERFTLRVGAQAPQAAHHGNSGSEDRRELPREEREVPHSDPADFRGNVEPQPGTGGASACSLRDVQDHESAGVELDDRVILRVSVDNAR